MSNDQLLIERLELALQLIAAYSAESFACQMARMALGCEQHDDSAPDWDEIAASVDAAGTYTG